MGNSRKSYEYDVGLSFAGEDRKRAEKLAEILKSYGISVFYDEYEQADLWGKDLYQHLAQIYQERCRYCILFLSKNYARKVWTQHELKQALARAIMDKGDYILPLRIDDTPIPGIRGTIKYIDLRKESIESVADLVVEKVKPNLQQTVIRTESISQQQSLGRRQLLKLLPWGGGALAIALMAPQILNSQSSTPDISRSPAPETTTSPIPENTTPPTPETNTPATPQLTPFEFKTVNVNANGEIVERSNEKANSFEEGLGNGITLEMVEIPGGDFTMGSPADEKARSEDEGPQRRVEVPGFFIGKYQVTQAQWKAVAALDKVNRDLKADPSRFEGDDRPVETVSWYDAVEFCERLSNHTGRKYRLPSEAQWEYACRAGTKTPFHFGEIITSELANYDATRTYGDGPKGKYRQETTPVGSFDVANAFGLYDMHGNVWEWCLDDWHDNYEGGPTDGSAWMSENDNLFQAEGRSVLRGGSWINYPVSCRSASRSNDDRSAGRVVIGNDNVGFRVVCAFGRASS